MSKQLIRVLIAACAACACAPAFAGVVFTFAQAGPNVVLTGSGTLVTTGLAAISTGVSGDVIPAEPFLVVGQSSFAESLYIVSLNTFAFGSGGVLLPSNVTGQTFGFTSSSVYVPAAYTSGASLSGTDTFYGKTFTSLGLTAGTYTYTYVIPGQGSDFFQVVIPGAANVPEPESIALLSIGLLAAFAAAQRRKSRAA